MNRLPYREDAPKAFVLPSPKHAMFYSCDHHAVKLLDPSGNLKEKEIYFQDTPERTAQWAAEQGYETYLLHEHVLKPDAKNPSQWRRWLKNHKKERFTL